MKYLARNYARFFIRGKLNRQVPVILSKELINCIEVLLEYRDQYGVPKSNPYLFGVPGRSHITLKACNLMRYYAKACGAPNPTRLRGTELRKQIATACSLYKLSDPLVEDMANHLGHHIDIHKKSYRQSIGRELPVITNILLKALGEYDEGDETIVDRQMTDSHNENEMHETTKTQECQEENDSHDSAMSHEYDRTPRITTNQLSPLANNQSPSVSHSLNDSGKQKRVSWSLPEIEAVRKSFGHYIDQSIVPTYDECHKCRAENLCLQKRTPPQIKSFVAHQTKKLKSNRKHSGRKAWSLLENKLVENEFAVFLKTKNCPHWKNVGR
ncbi:hypothetical protein JTB14_020181 [Gonioctena quinquepunctata]|nr:hypothetical protein JTB14_020181 [Gonioctena quinquepunctata]